MSLDSYKENNTLHHSIGVYFVSKENFGVGQKVEKDFSDLSFLNPDYFNSFIQDVKNSHLSEEELDRIKSKREEEIDASLRKLNNDIYENEKGLGENDRVYLVAASIIATLGIAGKVAPLKKSELRSTTEDGMTDGDIILQKIKAFLKHKHLPQGKQDLIVRTLQNTLSSTNINRPKDGESQLKRVFCKIVDDLGIYYRIGLSTDFTGKLFNEMYGWLGFSQDKLNDVVLTPSYVATLLAKLARINKDSYVWDFTTGSGGLLVAAMNEMIRDANARCTSPEELERKKAQIKAEQLLGIELLPGVYMLAILNLILMGDGSSNILNENSLDFDGNYGFRSVPEKFPATAYVLNPPYSANGCGMIFVEKALRMMTSGYAAIIIQSSAGAGKAVVYNQRILLKNTLIASIKMPVDIFIGKSSVQTHIYVFRVGEPHQADDIVKFIDLTNDGYTRTNRKKASVNLRDTDYAKERYQEVVDLVRVGRTKLHHFTNREYYEGTIDPNSGKDWNQHAPVDRKPTLSDLKETVSNFLAWEISAILKAHESEENLTSSLTKELDGTTWGDFPISDVFIIQSTNKKFDANKITLSDKKGYPYVVRTSKNNGIGGYFFADPEFLNQGNTISFGQDTATAFYQEEPYFTGDKIKIFVPKSSKFNRHNALFFVIAVEKAFSAFSWGSTSFNVKILGKQCLRLPEKNGSIDYDFIEKFMKKVVQEPLKTIQAYLDENS